MICSYNKRLNTEMSGLNLDFLSLTSCPTKLVLLSRSARLTTLVIIAYNCLLSSFYLI